MAYSNGYDVTAVTTALKDRIGFRQPLGSGVPTLASAVTTSASGRYFQDFHGLVTVENIKATMEQPGASDSDLITYLGNIRQAAIMRALNGVFTEAQIIDQPQPLFVRRGSNDQIEAPAGRFIGYEIDVADTADAALQIDSLSLLFDGAATFKVYCFKDGSTTALWDSGNITVAAGEIEEMVLTDKVLNRGKYFIGFFAADLDSAQPYRQQVKHWNPQRFFSARPMAAAATGATTFDREEITYTGEAIGLNLEISSFRDHTPQIKRKAAMFDELIGLVMAYQVIERIVYAVRSNVNERILKDQIDKVGLQLDLTGSAPISDSPQVQGLRQRIDREAARVRESFYRKPKSLITDAY